MRSILPLYLCLSLAALAAQPLAAEALAPLSQARGVNTFIVRGRVLQPDGSALPGARIAGAGVIAVSDESGNFALLLPQRPDGGKVTLTISFIGMKTQKQLWSEGQAFVVRMRDEESEIGEVVVRAKPNINALDIRAKSGVVAQVDIKQLQQKPMIDLALALQGAVPGLVVIDRGELGGKPEIRIRGNNSFTRGDGANEPLYVLDGKIISPQAFMTLNPLDIREIKVLKDAVATALYGIKAANGVLEISSRRGAEGPMTISVSSNYGVTLRGRQTTTMMRSAEKLELERLLRNPYTPGYLFSADYLQQTPLTDIQRSYASTLGLNTSWSREQYLAYGARQLDSLRQINTDWFRELIRPNTYQSHSLSLRGGSKEVAYYVSGNFTRQGGQLEGNDTKRFTLSNSLDWQSKMGFISLGLSGGYAKTNSPNSSSYSPQQLVYDLNPYESKDSRLLFSQPGRTYDDLLGQYRQWTKEVRLGTSLSANLHPIEGLQLDGIIGIDYVFSENEQITPATAYEEVTRRRPVARGAIGVGKNTDFNYSANLRASYNRVFAEKHDVSLSLNTDYYYNEGRQLSVSGHGIGQQEYLAGVNKGLTDADLRPDFNGTNTTSAQLGWGAALGYTYNQLIDLFAAYKADASSLLPKNKRWNTAWAVGGSLHFTKILPFLRGQKALTELGLKGSYGITANLGGITSASAVPVFGYQSGSFYADRYRLLQLQAMYNDGLKAEQLASIDLGLNLQLFGAHSLEVNLYRRDTKDALLQTDIAASNGFTSMLDNVGSLRNEGVEVSASTRILSTGDWRLTLQGSIAYNHSTVLDLYGRTALYTSGRVLPDYEVGRSYDYLYGLESLGVNPLTGDLVFRAATGEERTFSSTLVRSDFVGLGYSTPPYTGSVRLSWGYRAFDMDVQFYYVFGGIKPYNFNYVRDASSVTKNAIAGQVERSWFQPGDTGKLYPRPALGTTAYNNLILYPNSRMVASSDYLRLSMMSLRYRLPSSLLTKLGGVIKYASVAFQASNLFTLSPYKGGSPESGTYDLSVQPVLTANINLNF